MDVVAISIGGLAGLLVGLIVGFGVARLSAKPGGLTSHISGGSGATVEWWKRRETLTGTQLQILQYLETKRSSSISQLQEKFSFIPDRELYYRLEQIVLMQFVLRRRKEDQVIYELNPEYSAKVEDDKTVMLSGD